MKNKKGTLGTLGIILLVIVICAVVVGSIYYIKYLLLPVKVVTNQIDSAGNIIDKTYNADNAIYNYEWFKTQYERILANRNNIETQKQALLDFKELYGNDAKEWDYFTKEEYNRLNTIYIGLMNQDENLVADYNARSKMANRNIFNDKLPMNVDKMLR